MSKQVGKPIYIGEYGVREISNRKVDFPRIQNLIESENIGGSLVWVLLSRNNTHLCDEVPDNANHTYGVCRTNPDIQTLLINHGEAMFAKSFK